jgi:predicted XRE-type DNA-binding protein
VTPKFGLWKDLQARLFTPEQIAAADRYVLRETLRMELAELRKKAGKTQAQVAKLAKMQQGEVSRAERRRDHLISTVRRYVDALGGELELVVRLKGKTIRLRGV